MRNRRGHLGLGATSNGGNTGSWAKTRHTESGSTITGTRKPKDDETSDLITVQHVKETIGGRKVLIGENLGTSAAVVKHPGVSTVFYNQDGDNADALAVQPLRDSIAADSCVPRFSNNPTMRVTDVEMSTPGDPIRGADLMVRVGTDEYDVTFRHDFGRETTSIEAYNFRNGTLNLGHTEKQLLFMDITGQQIEGTLQETLNGMFEEVRNEVKNDPDTDNHLQACL